MKNLTRLSLAFLAIALATGCQRSTRTPDQSATVAQPSAASSAISPSEPDDNTPLPVPSLTGPKGLSVSGDYLHLGTGFVYPKVANGYPRVVLVALDPEEMDVTANYRIKRPDGTMQFSTYLYPITGTMPMITRKAARDPATCSQIFDQTVRVAMSIFEDANVLVTETVASLVDPGKSGHHAIIASRTHPVFEEQGMRGPLRTEIYLFCNIDTLWLLKYRITYPANMDARSLIAEMMKVVPQH